MLTVGYRTGVPVLTVPSSMEKLKDFMPCLTFLGFEVDSLQLRKDKNSNQQMDDLRITLGES